MPKPERDNALNAKLAGASFYALLQQYQDELVGLSPEEAMLLASFESDKFKPNAQPGGLSSAFGLTQPLRASYFDVWRSIAKRNPQRALAMVENSGLSIEAFREAFPNTYKARKTDEAALEAIANAYTGSQIHHRNYQGNFPPSVREALLYGRNNLENQLFFFIENNRLNAQMLQDRGEKVTIRNLYVYHNLGPTDAQQVIDAAQQYEKDKPHIVDAEQMARLFRALEHYAHSDKSELPFGAGSLSQEQQEALSALSEIAQQPAVKELFGKVNALEIGAEKAKENARLPTWLTPEVIKNNRSLTSSGDAAGYIDAVDRNLSRQQETVNDVIAFAREHGIDKGTLDAALGNIIYKEYQPISPHLKKSFAVDYASLDNIPAPPKKPAEVSMLGASR